MSLTLKDFLIGFKNQDNSILARAITLVESQNENHQKLAKQLLVKLKTKKTSRRIGISGTPGVGKSTFIEAYGLFLTHQKRRVAVLAVDPSSTKTGGSILGDKTRMPLLSSDPFAFIRPSPSQGELGGVARKTRECIQLCEAFGFDDILIETVGVGQSETLVRSMTDCFLLLLNPGAGDDLQGIKRGILESVDVVVITKADGSNLPKVQEAKHFYQNALHILRQDEEWQIPVLTCSSIEKTGLKDIEETFQSFFKKNAQHILNHRKDQLTMWAEFLVKEEVNMWLQKKMFPLTKAQTQKILSGKGPFIKMSKAFKS